MEQFELCVRREDFRPLFAQALAGAKGIPRRRWPVTIGLLHVDLMSSPGEDLAPALETRDQGGHGARGPITGHALPFFNLWMNWWPGNKACVAWMAGMCVSWPSTLAHP
jgi:hypothetical protein